MLQRAFDEIVSGYSYYDCKELKHVNQTLLSLMVTMYQYIHHMTICTYYVTMFIHMHKYLFTSVCLCLTPRMCRCDFRPMWQTASAKEYHREKLYVQLQRNVVIPNESKGQRAGPPGWLEESDPAGCDFVRDGRSMLPALTDHTTCPGLGLIYY